MSQHFNCCHILASSDGRAAPVLFLNGVLILYFVLYITFHFEFRFIYMLWRTCSLMSSMISTMQNRSHHKSTLLPKVKPRVQCAAVHFTKPDPFPFTCCVFHSVWHKYFILIVCNICVFGPGLLLLSLIVEWCCRTGWWVSVPELLIHWFFHYLWMLYLQTVVYDPNTN